MSNTVLSRFECSWKCPACGRIYKDQEEVVRFCAFIDYPHDEFGLECDCGCFEEYFIPCDLYGNKVEVED